MTAAQWRRWRRLTSAWANLVPCDTSRETEQVWETADSASQSRYRLNEPSYKLVVFGVREAASVARGGR